MRNIKAKDHSFFLISIMTSLNVGVILRLLLNFQYLNEIMWIGLLTAILSVILIYRKFNSENAISSKIDNKKSDGFNIINIIISILYCSISIFTFIVV